MQCLTIETRQLLVLVEDTEVSMWVKILLQCRLDR